tara:strand:- start:134 stop:673 length:540 start_codon:yes stop_codon:yes gene_type:complete
MKLSSIVFFFISTILNAQDNVSNAELSKKLDLILGKLGGLEERVTKLETDNVQVKKEVKEVAKSAEEAKTASQNLVIPQNEEEKKSFFNKLRIELESDYDREKGPWTQKDTWKQMKRNLTGHKVRMLLGNPSKIKRDLNPRIDQVYHYIGDLNADGTDENAKVNFYRDRVVSFTSPFSN